MKSFAVLHLQKGAGSGGGLGSHIDRSRKVLNADPELTRHNRHIVNHNGSTYLLSQKEFEQTKHPKLPELVRARIAEGRIEGPRDKQGNLKAIRKDAVQYVNVVMSGSHRPMADLVQQGKLDEWIKENYRWAVKEFGEKNIVRFAVHLDERTPHIHATVVPLTEDGRLSAKEVMGDKRKMSDRQTRYAEVMAQFGLERGIKGSTAKHEEVSEYYARIKNPVQAELSVPKRGFLEGEEKYRQKVIGALEGFILASKGKDERIEDLGHSLKLVRQEKDDAKRYLQLTQQNLQQSQQSVNKVKEQAKKGYDLLQRVAKGEVTPEQIKKMFEQQEQQNTQRKRGLGPSR